MKLLMFERKTFSVCKEMDKLTKLINLRWNT